MITITAFQSNAFQHNAFQIADTVSGSGGWRRLALEMLVRGRKESPTIPEVEELVIQARERTRLLFKPVPYVTTNLSPLIQQFQDAAERDRLKEEMDEFKQLLAALAAND